MPRPLVYEIHTRCWLRELSERRGQPVHLGRVPAEEFLRWRQLGFTHVWLMGVWPTGPRSRECFLKWPETGRRLRELLPDWREDDVTGSPYAIAGYRVAEELGGEAGLADFRRRLHEQGMQLILDFVPNHLGVDHRWLVDRPELFVQSNTPFPEAIPVETRDGLRWIAHGKDPNFPAWSDTVQLDHRRRDTRAAVIDQLRSVAERCDGVRCDMAMLLLREVFEKVWAALPSSADPSPTEFWAEAIAAVKRPGFLLIAEAYWDLEARLQSLGFDYTYDKRVTDFLMDGRPAEPARHLAERGDEFVRRSVHFLENHDEPRVAGRLSLAEHRPAALLTLALPGISLLHEGQLTGAKIRTPVHFARRPAEAPDADVVRLYNGLLTAIQDSLVGKGKCELLQPLAAWPGNPTAENFVVVQWNSPSPGAREFDLVAVNLAPHQGQCRVQPRFDPVPPDRWKVIDLLNESENPVSSAQMAGPGLLLDLPAHGVRLLRVSG